MANENEEKLPDDLKTFEATLGSLQPAARPIDRDRLMFLAGQASAGESAAGLPSDGSQAAGRRGWGWPLATAVSLLMSLSLIGRVVYLSNALDRLAVAGQLAANDQIALIDTTVGKLADQPPQRSAIAEPNYIALRNAVVNRGVDALPASRNVGRIAPERNSEPSWPLLGGANFGG